MLKSAPVAEHHVAKLQRTGDGGTEGIPSSHVDAGAGFLIRACGVWLGVSTSSD